MSIIDDIDRETRGAKIECYLITRENNGITTIRNTENPDEWISSDSAVKLG